MKITYLVTASLLALSTAPAFAETVESGGTGLSLKLSGQVNRGVLFADDGTDTNTFFVDNDNSSTRFRLTGEAPINDDWRAGFNIEIQAESNSTADVNQNDPNPSSENFLSERKLEGYIEGNSFGRLTFGQGDTASNNTSEVDLSGTAVVGYSGVEDAAGGVLFRNADGTLSDTSVGAAFTNLDGLSRRDRVRYDTPSFGGLSFAASVGADSEDADETFYDIAANYKGRFGSLQVAGAVAYANQTVADAEQEIVNGSFSALHDSGFSLTLAGGVQETEGVSDDVTFGYVKAGYQADWTSLGTTALAVDYAVNEHVLGLDDESTSYGLLAVQNIDAVGTELYAGLRNYEVDGAGDLDDVTVLLAGARFKF
ncbi:porin [Yoonia sp. 2307UL14-13]|uniref:porin n=1 Tax=Yoonia sp. 2307UL14-13 TaxID=3126506 RepID=UPI0030ACA694